MTDRDQMLVAWIRAKCARDFECERDVPFFSAHAEEGETPDETILRVFREERECHEADVTDATVLEIMIFG